MKAQLCLVLVFAYILIECQGSPAPSSCTASIVASARAAGSWTANGVSNQLYDITVTNTGRCPINSLFGFFGFPSTGSFSQAWNYDITTGEITNFGSYLAPGESFAGAGFVLSGGVTPTLAFNTPICPAACTGASTSADSTAAATTGGATTTAQATTGASSSSTTGVITCDDLTCGHNQVCINDGGFARCENVSLPCTVSTAISARSGASFIFNGVPSQIYDLDISNSGYSTVTSLVVEITPVSGTEVVQDNMWNLVHTGGKQYTVAAYGSLTPGAHFFGAGFVLSGTNSSTATPSVVPFNVTC